MQPYNPNPTFTKPTAQSLQYDPIGAARRIRRNQQTYQASRPCSYPRKSIDSNQAAQVQRPDSTPVHHFRSGPYKFRAIYPSFFKNEAD